MWQKALAWWQGLNFWIKLYMGATGCALIIFIAVALTFFTGCLLIVGTTGLAWMANHHPDDFLRFIGPFGLIIGGIVIIIGGMIFTIVGIWGYFKFGIFFWFIVAGKVFKQILKWLKLYR
ncbi:MAG: hypothetical protein ACOZAR_01390 [Patescibacteria group bacterium]